jgi:hypothetical protein
MRVSRAIIFSTAFVCAIFLTSCEDAEDRKIASAQKCLNGLGDSPTQAAVDVCIGKVAGIDNEQSNIILCSAYFIRGGLTNSKIITAFDTYDDAAAADKEATLIDLLSLGSGGSSKSDADNAFTYCNKTGIAGLAYVASLCRIGTYVDQMTCAGTCSNVDEAIDYFVGNIGPGASTADKEAVGEMVGTLSELYCQGEAKESNICVEIFSAQQAAGTDYELLAEILLNQFLN